MAQTKILITGATGYTGRYTTETLIEQGFSVRALVPKLLPKSLLGLNEIA
jgi:uncharacterized protein YbjT (DUF2867 family)